MIRESGMRANYDFDVISLHPETTFRPNSASLLYDNFIVIPYYMKQWTMANRSGFNGDNITPPHGRID